MEQQVITDISLSARIIGAAFYYPPTEKSDIVELLSSGKWLTEWPYGSEEEKQRIASLLAQTTYQDETLAQAYQRLFIGPYALLHHLGDRCILIMRMSYLVIQP